MLIGLHGYTCTGNFGDQAMAEAIVLKLIHWGHKVKLFRFGADALDEAEFRRMGIEVVDQTRRFDVRELDCLIVGGGALGVGFGWQLIGEAYASKKRLIAFCQDYDTRWMDAAALARPLLRAHKLVLTRSGGSLRILENIGVHAERGGEPAFTHPYAEFPAKRTPDKKALVFVRAPNWEYPEAEQRRGVAVVEAKCAEQGWRPRYIVSARGDYDFTVQFGQTLCPRTWQEIVDEMADAVHVFSVGRYHPAVFASAVAVPWTATDPKSPALWEGWAECKNRAELAFCSLKAELES